MHLWQKQVIMGLIDELTTFCANTSLKGVPRILRSKSLSLKTLWMLAVMGFLCVSGYEAYKLISEYISYPKVTSVTEKMLNLTGGKEGADLPDIMLCNLNPFSTEAMNTSRAPSVQQYHQRVLQVTSCDNCSDAEQEALFKIRASLLTTFGYYQYLGTENITSISHSMDSFIVSCHVVILDGISYSKEGCQGKVNITSYMSKLYYSCYNLHLFAQEKVMGISVILYLDNFDLEFAEYFNIFSDVGQNVGATALLYEQGTVPLLAKDGISLAPGTSNDIKFVIEKRERLTQPHGTCSEMLHVENLDKLESTEEKTTMESCSSFCVEQHVAEQCGCLDTMSLGILESQNLGLPYCGSVNLEHRDLLQKLSCAKAVRNKVISECIDSCPLRCIELLYPTKASQSAWPQRPLTTSFYSTFIQNRTYEWRFSDLPFHYKNISRPVEDYYHESSIIKENFLKITFYLSDNKYITLVDSPKIHSSNLISQLGGTLNLWSGITMCLFVEIIELVIRVIMPKSRRAVDDAGGRPSSPATHMNNFKHQSNGRF